MAGLVTGSIYDSFWAVSSFQSSLSPMPRLCARLAMKNWSMPPGMTRTGVAWYMDSRKLPSPPWVMKSLIFL